MIKQLITFLLFLAPYYFSQIQDSSNIVNISTNIDTLDAEIADTTFYADSLQTTVLIADTLVPIQGGPLSESSTIIDRRTFLFTNYRYTGDLLRSFQFNFIKEFGFIGYPNETFIYGVGNGGVSYLQDGVLWNGRYTNSLDLNLIQSEDIDSIEIVPLPRGFLYGSYNNPVTVNFIMRDFVPKEPYTRIKYYEGPNGEAMIDGKFNAQVAKRWNLSFQVTNRTAEETYKNTEFGIWQANAKLKYFLSNSINLTGWYYFVSSSQGLNGGVDIDSLSKISNYVDEDLYEPLLAPVVYPNQKLDVTQHSFGLRTLIKPYEDGYGEVSLYFRKNSDELRDKRDSINISEDLKDNIFGSKLTYYHRIGALSLNLDASYESNSYNNDEEQTYNNIPLYTEAVQKDYEIFNLGGVATLHFLNDDLESSVFYRYNNIKFGNPGSNRTGGGIDLSYKFRNLITFYLGYSTYTNYDFQQSASSFEVSSRLNVCNLLVDLRYFNNEYSLFQMQVIEGPRPLVIIPPTNVKGVGLNLNYKLWLIRLETNSSYYFNETGQDSHIDPRFQFIGGIYVNDKFFDNNLDLKAGFKFCYTEMFNLISEDWFATRTIDYSNKLDFTLAGEIKKVAIFYFIWENLFDNKYYMTAYYPMPRRNIRFGLAWELFN